MGVFSNSYRYQTINNFKKLLDKKDIKNTSIIIILILINISMYIRPIKFLENNAPKIVYDINKKI